jgi:hypothetical protein
VPMRDSWILKNEIDSRQCPARSFVSQDDR